MHTEVVVASGIVVVAATQTKSGLHSLSKQSEELQQYRSIAEIVQVLSKEPIIPTQLALLH
jgi:hypothetical protein